MFTAENFRKIFDRENRKGLNIAKRFFPSLNSYTQNVKNAVEAIKVLRSNNVGNTSQAFLAQVEQLKADLIQRKLEKSSAIDELMGDISDRVHKPQFRLALTQKMGPQAKAVFCIDNTPETFFIVKQLQQNIKRIYSVKPASRYDLVSRVRDTVNTKFPFEIVRTDISSFYESIDRDQLSKKLDEDQLLSASSKRFIQQILNSYGSIARAPQGIPRGVGISAYLAELYLRPVDRQIMTMPGLVLYCRYVDDIVAIFSRPPSGSRQGSYKDDILSVLSERGLAHNPSKTDELFIDPSRAQDFDYLGYHFRIQSGKCQTSPSAAKVSRYEKRINASFDEYTRRAYTSSRRAHRELISRVKFLTGNTRLVNSKSSAVTGIYYNNSLATDVSALARIDNVLATKIASLQSPSLRAELSKYTFAEGFFNRRFHNFNTQELQKIVKAWKHV
jgi:hypothetical protein